MSAYRGDTIARLLALVLRVQAGPLPARAALARDLGCSERTVARLLRIIETRLPVRWQSGRMSHVS